MVLRAERKEMEWSTGIWRRVKGIQFQVAEPAIEKARCCLVAVLDRGTIRSDCAAERRQQRRWTCVVEQQSSSKNGGGRASKRGPAKAEIIIIRNAMRAREPV